MSLVLIGTQFGCRTIRDGLEVETELMGRQVSALTPEDCGACLAVVDQTGVWRRGTSGTWSQISETEIPLQALASTTDTVFAGTMNEASILRIDAAGHPEQLRGFDDIEGRGDWFQNGPPLGIRSLSVTSDGQVLLAAVHVGGIPRSSDRGKTWTPTIPVTYDVHEVKASPTQSNFIAAAAAVGLCESRDSGFTWKAFGEGFENMTSLAVAVMEHEVLFSIQDGPFASRSQIWRHRMDNGRIEQVRDGLPEWLEGKVDTGWIATGDGRAAIVDGGGNLWLTAAGSVGWQPLLKGLPYVLGLAII